MGSVYIHIPFCRSICSYCDFCKVILNDKWTKDYLHSLKEEIKEFYLQEEINTLYIGGGTPSCLGVLELKYLFKMLKIFKMAKDYEFTFECNLEDINEELLDILKLGGVNRLSIGTLSFNEKHVAFMGRKFISFKKTKEIMKLCRAKGFDNVNLDLIYGLPDETIFDLKKDLNNILKLKPEHISTYSLILEDNTILGVRNIEMLEADEDALMYDYICKMLKKKKYNHYEVSNFALNNHFSKHNLNYWKNNEYYGFGLGAHGNISGFRYENTPSLSSYLNKKWRKNQNLLSKTDMMENELMLGLRLLSGISIQEFYDKYKINVQEVFDFKEVIKNKDIIYKKGYIFIPEGKIYVMNEILIKLL